MSLSKQLEHGIRDIIQTRIVGPAPNGSALVLVGWIRIQESRIDAHEKGKEIPCFEVLDVLFFGLTVFL
jgi:hypothetical protein